MQPAIVFLFLTVTVLLINASPSPSMYLDYESIVDQDDSDNGVLSDRDIYSTQVKRACIPRGGNCDHRASDCCYSTVCRCNLWGANCRCQRKGLFTKLG
ncbi:hypothetical protein O3M35_006111 [Rhynocoris fuscipes]|uniref:U8-agatoxin-Ao1a n=1 Tax=Rhynocoris fuscipes TaxID=488301 RepID=A0AAW1DER4_9HEMI